MHGHPATCEEELLATAGERDQARAEVEQLRAALSEACDEIENMVGVDDEVTTAWRALLR